MTENFQTPNMDAAGARAVVHGALCYCWHEGAFLSIEKAEYALERLWHLVAGLADWDGDPVLFIPSVDEKTVNGIFELLPGSLPWIALRDILPPGSKSIIDSDRLPVLCKVKPTESHFNGESCFFPMDLVAATFLLLSRWEESGRTLPRDAWGNVDESSLFLNRQKMLKRPVLDEWGLVLQAWIRACRPRWHPRMPPFRVLPTHDIDHLFHYPSPTYLPRRLAGSALYHRSLRQGFHTLREGYRSILDPTTDPGFRRVYDLADRDESLNARGVFFFMSAENGPLDDGYAINSPEAKQLLTYLNERGHVIGWHPGYEASEQKDLFVKEAERMYTAAPQAVCHVRMHYLRWRDYTTEWIEEVGGKRDYSWGLNEVAGFAHGTAKPFPIWDVLRNRATSIIEIPFVFQESTLPAATPFDRPQAMEEIVTMINRVKRVGGVFSFLLHNTAGHRAIRYEPLINSVYRSLQ